jgi:glycosyltransferase involved in cell wall biosynthesis
MDYIERWRAWMGSCDAITYAADWIRELLLRNGIPRESLVELPLPPPTVGDVLPRHDFWSWAKPDAFRLLFAGRVLDIKGTHILIDAVRHHLMKDNVALCLIGAPQTPSYAVEIRQAVASDDRIRWLPQQSESASLGAQLACDAVVVPSLWPETGPYSVLEAQWLGATIVGSNRAGIAQLLECYPGAFRFEPGEPAALADALRLAARQPRTKIPFDRAAYSARFGRALDNLVARAEPAADVAGQ